MSSPSSYDQGLLASAPAATRVQLQEGYTTDILDSPHGGSTSPHPTPLAPSHFAPQSDPELDSVSASKELNGHSSKTKTVPFWRTTKGIVLIILAIIVVLGAVIGGAVGGTRKTKNATAASPAVTTTSGSGGLSAGSPTTSGGIGISIAPPNTSIQVQASPSAGVKAIA